MNDSTHLMRRASEPEPCEVLSLRGALTRLPSGDDWRDRDGEIRYGLIRTPELLDQAARVEQRVWNENDYGDLGEEGYGDHIAHSRTFAAFAGQECIGINRLFVADTSRMPPFLSGALPFYDEGIRESLLADVKAGVAEELGTVAVVASMRGDGVNTRLWRLAYRDARARGIRHWGIIMEPARVRCMNRAVRSTFRRLGPAVYYQGGECAAHAIDLHEYEETIRHNHPHAHWWWIGCEIRP
jgi:hypothetical protein